MTTTITSPSILIVDDEEKVRKTIHKSLTMDGYCCLEAGNATQALECLGKKPAELVILDIIMPGGNGCELLPKIRKTFPETAVIMATAVIEPDTIIQCMRDGADDYITKPFEPEQVIDSIKMVLEKRMLALEIKTYQYSVEDTLNRQAKEIQKTFAGAVESLISALEAKDKYTAGHSRRVTRISEDIGKVLLLPEDEIENIRWAALLHDIGKIGVDPAIQNKSSTLTEEEYQHVMRHCSIGPNIVQSLVNTEIIGIISHHHDHFNSGKLVETDSGRQIQIGARVIAVADAFDAMTSDRPYRLAMPTEEAIIEIKRCSGVQFDPQVVEAFLKTQLHTTKH